MSTIPRLEHTLPELFGFTQQLAERLKTGTLPDWDIFTALTRNFYTASMMAKIERVTPGWAQMASYADQQTLIHVTSVLTALHLLPEYQHATPDERALIEWTVLYHDVAKVPRPGNHDYIHAFRSAIAAARGLPLAGFPTAPDYSKRFSAWSDLTYAAILLRRDVGEVIQDNQKLPEISSGIAQLFGVGNPAISVIKSVLLHLSVVTDPGYPILAPLSEGEILRYVDAATFPIFKMMMLVDTDGWSLFDPENRERQRQQTLRAFEKIAATIRYYS